MSTGIDHQHDETVVLAALWLAGLDFIPQPIVPELKTRFGISTVEACEVCRLAQDIRVGRRARS